MCYQIRIGFKRKYRDFEKWEKSGLTIDEDVLIA